MLFAARRVFPTRYANRLLIKVLMLVSVDAALSSRSISRTTIDCTKARSRSSPVEPSNNHCAASKTWAA